VIATKTGHARPFGSWVPLGRPEYLIQQAELSLRRLRLDCLDLLQLHRVDPAVPLADQVGALRALQDKGMVRHVGLSEVDVDQIVEASATSSTGLTTRCWSTAPPTASRSCRGSRSRRASRRRRSGRPGRRASRRHRRPGRARVAAATLAGGAADPRHVLARTWRRTWRPATSS
jgi:hypothetical protein